MVAEDKRIAANFIILFQPAQGQLIFSAKGFCNHGLTRINSDLKYLRSTCLFMRNHFNFFFRNHLPEQ